MVLPFSDRVFAGSNYDYETRSLATDTASICRKNITQMSSAVQSLGDIIGEKEFTKSELLSCVHRVANRGQLSAINEHLD